MSISWGGEGTWVYPTVSSYPFPCKDSHNFNARQPKADRRATKRRNLHIEDACQKAIHPLIEDRMERSQNYVRAVQEDGFLKIHYMTLSSTLTNNTDILCMNHLISAYKQWKRPTKNIILWSASIIKLIYFLFLY